MGTPFATATAPASAVVVATDAQLSYIESLLARHDWRNSTQASYVSRAAVINMLLPIVQDEEKLVSYKLHLAVDLADALGVRLNHAFEVMAFEAAPEMAYCWKPLDKAGASALIGWLKGLPEVAAAPAPITAASTLSEIRAAQVPAGRYAIDTIVHAVNGTAFYKVDRPTEGKWAGRVFVKQIIGGDEQRLSQKQGGAIITRVAAVGAEAASARYGHEIGECGMCGRQLTNDESRARGIGPICAAKAGW